MSQLKLFVKQWEALGQISALCRWSSVISSALALVMGMGLVITANRDPLVITERCGQRNVAQARRRPIKIDPKDVKRFALDFVTAVYGDETPKQILMAAKCTTTEGFLEKLSKKLGPQKIAQYVGRATAVLEEGKTMVSFDRIVTIDKTPIAARQTVELKIVQDTQTACNPLGLYVNAMTVRKGP
ncbi:MAG: hypothetical protein OXB88_00320 [Bacteriovoracales bacterium]|nr:hypothetical protein [Bacteriovoracales bacterium]